MLLLPTCTDSALMVNVQVFGSGHQVLLLDKKSPISKHPVQRKHSQRYFSLKPDINSFYLFDHSYNAQHKDCNTKEEIQGQISLHQL